MQEAERNLAAVKQLAAQFPGVEGELSLSVSWEGPASFAGVAARGDVIEVVFGSASAEVASFDEAADLIGRIMRDEVVAVTAFVREAIVSCELAPANDPTIHFNKLDRPGLSRNMPDIDEVHVLRWSGREDD